VKSGVPLRWTISNFTAEMNVSKSIKGYSILRRMTCYRRLSLCCTKYGMKPQGTKRVGNYERL
jgi:hypothetical protein